MNQESIKELHSFGRQIIENSVIGGNLSFLHDSLTDENRERMTIADIGRRLAITEEGYGMFTRIGKPTKPVPSSIFNRAWEFEYELFIRDTLWFAHFCINNEGKLCYMNFYRKPSYVCPSYFNIHKVLSEDICQKPKIVYTKPALRKTTHLPVSVLIHTVVHVDIDGHIGLRYPFKDMEYLAQKKIGLIRGEYSGWSEPDPVISMAKLCINKAISLKEASKIVLIVHSFAALMIKEILADFNGKIGGIVLLNPAWEAAPGSNLRNMSKQNVPKGIPCLIIGSEYDQILTVQQYEKWKKWMPSSEYIVFPKTDHFIMDCDYIPEDFEYKSWERHVNVEIIHHMRTWINSL